MKLAFTMIEFIFVLIILFIISAVIIPKLKQPQTPNQTQGRNV